MIRNLALLAFSAALLLVSRHEPLAQTATRAVELRIVGVSRGYLRPLRNTGTRVEKLFGPESVVTLGSRAGITRFQLRTSQDSQEIAKALGLVVVDSKQDKLTLALKGDEQAYRAEARLVILAITDAIRVKCENTPGEDGYRRGGILAKGSTEQQVKALGLDPRILDGRFYKAKDYHLDEQGSSGFLIWAGTKYEGVSVGGNYYDYSAQEDETEPDSKSNFVGAKLMCDYWNSGFWWVDLHGVSLNVMEYERDAVTQSGKEPRLAVAAGAERITTLIQAGAKYRYKGDNAKKAVSELVKGNFGNNWQLREALEIADNYWQEYPYYADQNFSLSWFKSDQTGHIHARIKAHNTRHPLHLDGDLDVEAAREVDFDFAKAPIHWTVGAEADVSVFDVRRAEIAKGIGVIKDALFALDAEAAKAVRNSNLADAELLALLKLKAEDLKGEHFSAGDYWLTPQMLGDVEVRAGSAIRGCESWVLFNVGNKSVIRSYR